MISGKINSYKGFIQSKKIYLKRKKSLNREIKEIKKRRNIFKHKVRRMCLNMVISKGEDDLELLRIMYKLNKNRAKAKKVKHEQIWNMQ